MKIARSIIIFMLLCVLVVPHSIVQAATIPVVVTADAYIFYDSGLNTLWIDVWCDPNDYAGSTSMLAQYREQGDEDWIPISPIREVPASSMYWWNVAVPAAHSYEVRGAAFYNASWVYGNTITLYSPPLPDPYVSTGQALWVDDTVAKVSTHASPASYPFGNVYVQYREVGESEWDQTHKVQITDWQTTEFTITGLAIATATEARAALDYSTTTIYGEIRTITEADGSFDMACEYQPEDGDGSSGDPYIITDICELSWMRNDLDAYYELGNDIDAFTTSYWNWNGSYYSGFVPIGRITGSVDDCFEGQLDGKEYTVTGLYIDAPDTGIPNGSNTGLFALPRHTNTGAIGIIKNLTLQSPSVKNRGVAGGTGALAGHTAAATLENIKVFGGVIEGGGGNTGGIVGTASEYYDGYYYYDYTDLTDCHFEGTVTRNGTGDMGGLTGKQFGGQVTRCSANVAISGKATNWNNNDIGVLAGFAQGATYSQCFAVGSIYAPKGTYTGTNHPNSLGGAVGYVASGVHFHNCYARVDITTTGTYARYIGGFAGTNWSSGTYLNCYSTGAISTDSTHEKIGGFLGYQATSGSTTFTALFWDTQTSGYSVSEAGTGKTTAEMKTTSTFTDAGWDFTDIWGRKASINDGYPHLQALSYELEVETLTPSEIDATTITAVGDITAADPNATSRGFVYMEGISGTPSLSDDWVVETGDFGTGEYSLYLTVLTPETYYRVRSFAASDELFAYGNTITVQTSAGPTAVTLPAEQMDWQWDNERRLHGYLESDGGSDCQVRFQWGLADDALDNNTSWLTTYPGGCPIRGYQTGDYFYADLGSLEMDTTYYFRAQAENDEGLSSGEILSFTIGEGVDEDFLRVVTYDATDKTATAFLAHGALLAADPEAFRRGFVYLEGGYGTPDLTDSVVQEGGSFGPSTFSLSITGLTSGSEYRVRAFAESDWGIVYGNTLTIAPLGAPVVVTYDPTDLGETSFRARGEVTETGPPVTRRGFVYKEGTTGTPDLSDDVVDAIGSWDAAPFSLTVTGLTGGTYYRVRAFATNSIATSYGNTVTARTYGAPDVTTNAATHIGLTTARLHGVITDDGGSACQWRFQWGEATGVYDDDSAWTGSLNSGEAFYLDIEGLSTNTTYYFRAQGRNAVGLASGSELSFTTADALGDPSDLLATPISGSQIALTWTKGGGSDNTLIQIMQSGYPATPLDGTTVYFGSDSAYTVGGLTPGTTYYIRAWAEGDGTYSTGYTDDMATTLAGAPEDDPPDWWDPDWPWPPDDDPPDDWPDDWPWPPDWSDPWGPDGPPGWFQDPDPTSLEDMPGYDQVNDLFDSYGLPWSTGWAILALFLAALAGVLTLVLTNGNIWLAMTAGGAVIVGTTWIGLISFWILFVYIVCVGGFAFIRSRV